MSHPPDEILSALLDGEATDGADAAHIEVCSTCQDRLDALRSVSAALSAPLAPPAAHLREAAVSAALVETTGASGVVRRLAMARRSRALAAASSARRMSAASAAAALLVALGVGGWLVSQAGQSDPKTTGANLVAGAANRTESANPTGSNDKSALAGRPSAAAGGAGGSNAFSSAPEVTAADAATSSWSYGYDAGEIGAFDNTEQLAAVAKHDLEQDEDVKAQHHADGSPCPMPPNSQQVWTAKVSYQGKPAAAWVRTTESGWLLEVLDVSSACAILASQAI